MSERASQYRLDDACASAVATGAVLLASHTLGLALGLLARAVRLDPALRRLNRLSAAAFPGLHWGGIFHLVPERARVLDVGAGDCLLAAALRKLRRSRVTCVDVEIRGETDIPVIRFDGLHLPFPDRSFDVVLLSYVLHHLDSPAELLRECARTCRGRVLVVEDAPLFGRRFYEWGHHRMYNCLLPRPDGLRYGPVRLRYDHEWRGLFSAVGLRVAGAARTWSLGSFPMKRAVYTLKLLDLPNH